MIRNNPLAGPGIYGWMRKLTMYILVSCLSSGFVHGNSGDTLSLMLDSIESAGNDSERVDRYCRISCFLSDEKEYTRALQFAEKALSLAREISYQKGISDALYYAGMALDYLDRYPEAISRYHASMELSMAVGDIKGVASCYRNMAILYDMMGNYPESIKNYYQALKYYEQMDDRKGMARCYDNIGIVYAEEENYDESIKNLETGLRIFETLNDSNGIVNSFNNLGVVYGNKKDYDKALGFHRKALEVRMRKKNMSGVANSYSNLGVIAYFRGDLHQSLEYHLQGLQLKDSLGLQDGVAYSSTCVGQVYTALAREQRPGIQKKEYLMKARQYLETGLEISFRLGQKGDVAESYFGLTELDTVEGNFRQAYRDYNSYILYKDSLLNEENIRKMVQSKMQYEFEKKEAVLKSEQDKKSTKRMAESKRRTMVLIFVSFLLVVVALFAGYVFRSLRITRSRKKMIEQQKILVEEKQKEILDSIHYARRIQLALLPKEIFIEKSINRLLKES